MKIINYLKKLDLEEKILATNWLLCILTWLIFFGVITGGIIPIVLISITPVLGYFTPSLIKKIKEYFFKRSASDNEYNNSSKINANKDSSLKATSKFILHSFINVNILYYSIKTLFITYGFASTGCIGLILSAAILLVMIPIIAKEFRALCTVYKYGKPFKKHIINKANLLKSILIAIAISSAIFFILCAVATNNLVALSILYPSIIFIIPLVVIEFLLLVTYLSYVILNNQNINKWEITCNIITFIGGTFSLLFAVFELSAATGVINITALTHMSIYLAVGTATMHFLFPIIVVFSLAVIAFLIEAPAITEEPKDNLDKTQKYNNMKNNRHLVNIDNGRLVTPVTAASLSPQSNNNSAAVSNIHNKQEELGQQPVHIN